jgi:hypothetical protein
LKEELACVIEEPVQQVVDWNALQIVVLGMKVYGNDPKQGKGYYFGWYGNYCGGNLGYNFVYNYSLYVVVEGRNLTHHYYLDYYILVRVVVCRNYFDCGNCYEELN